MAEDTFLTPEFPAGFRVRSGGFGSLVEVGSEKGGVDEGEVWLGGLRLMTRSIVPGRGGRDQGRCPDPRSGQSYHLLIPLAGRLEVVRGHERFSAGVGDLLVHGVPCVIACDVWPPDGRFAFQAMCITVPKPLLNVNLPAEHLDGLLSRPLSSTEGIGGLLTDFTVNISQSAHELRPADGQRLGMTLASLISALFLHALEAEGVSVSGRSHRHALALRVQGFIQRHLREPDLTPRVLATAHHISISYLHRVFQDEGLRVTAWIKAQRLERVRHDLADPALRHVPIRVVASGWGFSHASDFSRAFRRAYGISASEFRQHALPS
ncbi:helix-turn-helix domain-containing protein [Nonomuraea longispora]|uniref:Helix-turn-helix domain-containing protein n=1 Tax=Nonomuraea longispora TaxID=1848320 RepID=A0A4R4NK03_9ACTN|nr:helix-turn-helix domain-containing protein [Nonomuraea longispora]TDC09698.1 helix-turn-helix domain-containing protein [Nonomuraea longispora]